MDYDHSIRVHPYYQYSYGRTPLYCSVDDCILSETTCGFWMDLDGSLDAPEFMPVGCRHGSDKHGTRVYKDFVPRGWTLEEDRRRQELAERLIKEVVEELETEGAFK